MKQQQPTKSNRGRKPVAQENKRTPVAFYLPTKNHAKFRKEVEAILKKYL